MTVEEAAPIIKALLESFNESIVKHGGKPRLVDSYRIMQQISILRHQGINIEE